MSEERKPYLKLGALSVKLHVSIRGCCLEEAKPKYGGTAPADASICGGGSANAVYVRSSEEEAPL